MKNEFFNFDKVIEIEKKKSYNQALEDVITECERFKNQYKTFYFQDLVDISKKIKAKYETR